MRTMIIAGCAAVALAAFAKTPAEVSKEHHNYPVRYCADTESEEAKQSLIAELWKHDPAVETKLWPEGKVPLKANDKPIKFLEHGLWSRNLTVTDVNDPFFTFFPAKGEGAKPVVVILPGGGYRSLGWNKEGTEVAEWLNSLGFSAAVLLYRVPDQRDAALCDIQRTIGILRRDASKYSIDRGRVGVIGFSAGANLAIRASTNWRKRLYERVDDADDYSCRPDFHLPIYPWDIRTRKDPSTPQKGWTGMDIRPEYTADSETPPAFIAQSLDDFCEAETAVTYDMSLRRAGVSSTTKIYLDGGHGYGLRRLGHATDTWPYEAASWLAQFARPSGERIGVCSWSFRKPLREVADEMEKAGIKGIHLALGPFIRADGRHGDAESAEAWAFVKEQVKTGKWNLMCTMIGTVGENYSTLETIKKTGGIVPDEHWAANQEIVRKGAALTQELGCRYMSLHGGFLDESDPVAYAKYVSRIRWIRDTAKEYGVTVLLESGQETAEDLAKFMADVPGVGINFDPANMILYAKGRPIEALNTLIPWIRQVHVKDACATKKPGTWGTEVPWGEGEVGGCAFLDRLKELGYKGNLVIEREGGASRVKDINMAKERLEK